MLRVGGGDADLGKTDLSQGNREGVQGGDEMGDEVVVGGGHDLVVDGEKG